MKTETELRKYLEEVRIAIPKEEDKYTSYQRLVGKTILSTIMYVLEDSTCIDLNRLEDL